MEPNEEQQAIAEALAQWRAQDRELGVSARVREIVLAAPLPAAAPQPRPVAWDWRPWAMAAAVLLTIAAVWFASPRAQQRHMPAARMATDFFPLTPAGLESSDPAQLVRIRVPRREMRRFGLPVREELERSAVEAEVVVGPDGIARAVRFVQEREFE